MKIGIITIHAAFNYGSALQAYALQSIVKQICPNDIVEIINYLPSNIMNAYSLSPFSNMKNMKMLVKYFASYSEREKKSFVFHQFQEEYMNLSNSKFVSDEQLEMATSKWEFVILGSDQVWNPEIVGNNQAFFLKFSNAKRKISFSSSFGTVDISSEYLKELEKNLRDFYAISVRENTALALLKDLSSKISVTCDPVFLLSAKQWELLEKKIDVPSKYIIFYSVEKNIKLEKLAKGISEKVGIPIIDIGSRCKPFSYIGYNIPSVGPQEFLFLMHNATYVITNSFHGMAFSIIYRKKFVNLLHKTRGTRIEELSKLTNRERYLLNENISSEEALDLLQRNEEPFMRKLENQIEQSISYLQKVLTIKGD